MRLAWLAATRRTIPVPGSRRSCRGPAVSRCRFRKLHPIGSRSAANQNMIAAWLQSVGSADRGRFRSRLRGQRVERHMRAHEHARRNRDTRIKVQADASNGLGVDASTMLVSTHLNFSRAGEW